MSTVPMLSPDGKMGDVPHDNVPAAIKAGFKIGADLVSPDGKAGIVPLDRVHDAINAGFMLKGANPQAPANPIPVPPKSVGDQIGDMATGAAKNLYQVSAPGVATSILARQAPQVAAQLPDQMTQNAAPLEQLPGKIITTGLPMMVGDEVPQAARPAQAVEPSVAPKSTPAASILDHPAVTPWVDAAKAEVMKIPGANLAKTIWESAKGLTKSDEIPTNPPTPAGPPAQWGQRIEQASPAEVPVTPKAPEEMPTKSAPTPEAQSAAEPPSLGKREMSKVAKQAQALNPNAKPQTQAAALKQPIADIVDKAIPLNGKTVGANLVTKAKVEMALKQGDVEAATKALKDGADKAGLPAPKVNEPLVPGSKADLMDDRHVEESIRTQYDQHGEAAWREMLREQADRNSMDTPKWERVAASRTGADPAARVPYPRFTEDLKDITDAPKAELAARQNFIAKHGMEPPQDLTDILQKSVDAAKAAKK